MRKYFRLTKRNCLVFLRDRGAVFFSLLSMFIVLMLMGVFLGNMNVEEVTGLLQSVGGVRDAALDKENAAHLIQYWTLAGILVVNALTVTLTVLGVMVSDANENRLAGFYGAPVDRKLVALSYISAAVFIGTFFCMITLAVSLLYICATGGGMLSAGALIKIILYTMLNVCIFSIIMFFVALFVKSSSAWSGIATVMGTLVGFLGAIYLPMGFLPAGVADVLKCIPILHGASLMRKVCCADALDVSFAGLPEEVVAKYQEYMGITVSVNDKIMDSRTQIFFLAFCGILAMAATVAILKKKNISDR